VPKKVASIIVVVNWQVWKIWGAKLYGLLARTMARVVQLQHPPPQSVQHFV